MKTLLKLEKPVPLSIAELGDEEEVFLSMKLREDGDYGTGIERSGDSPPTVEWANPPHRITDSHAQRRGSWFIRSGDKAKDDDVSLHRLSATHDLLLRNDLDAMLSDAEAENCHELMFPRLFPGWRIRGMQCACPLR